MTLRTRRLVVAVTFVAAAISPVVGASVASAAPAAPVATIAASLTPEKPTCHDM